VRPGITVIVPERQRILVLDLLETFVRERDVSVDIERLRGQSEWNCVLTMDGVSHQIFRGRGATARSAIMAALHGAGVTPPE
jgi:hypothetical protein